MSRATESHRVDPIVELLMAAKRIEADWNLDQRRPRVEAESIYALSEAIRRVEAGR